MNPTNRPAEVCHLFSNEASARQRLEAIRWPDGVSCPHCRSTSIDARKAREEFYDCRECHAHFSVRTGTVFENSEVKLRKWIYAIYLLMTSRKSISSMQLGEEIGVPQKTAWFILHRLRLACSNDLEQLRGIVGIDATDSNEQEPNKRARKRKSAAQGGHIKSKSTANTDMTAMHREIDKHFAHTEVPQ